MQLSCAVPSINQLITNMKKHFRMIAGIILHPVKVIFHLFYRKEDEYDIRSNILDNWWNKNHERMHHFGPFEFPSASCFNHSELYGNLYHGALDRV